MNELIKNFIPARLKLFVRRCLFNARRILQNKSKLITEYKYQSIGNLNRHNFFGYYDISPFGKDGYFIYHEVNKDGESVNIVLYNINTLRKRIIATSRAWNWQQGSRLRWMPGDDESIIFNDFVNGCFCSREVNVFSNSEIKHKYPLYDISPDGKLGISLDFLRLGYKRPGYGYTNLPFNEDEQILEKGISIIDMSNDDIIKIITYRNIAEIMGIGIENQSDWYINHLSFSPTGNRFLFFFVQDKHDEFVASLLYYDIPSQRLRVLEKELKVSHYDWLNDDVLLCTACNKHRCWYNVYSLLDGKVSTFCPNLLTKDGHPTYISESKIITDTYPDDNMYQYLYLVDRDKNEVKVLASVFQVLFDSVEKRTDLHPRLSEDSQYIAFDCNMNGKREIIILFNPNRYGK